MNIRFICRCAAAWLVLFSVAATNGACGDRVWCSHVIDGDTIVVARDGQARGWRGERVRLLGIDTPELAHPEHPSGPMADEPGAQEAAEYLRGRIEGRYVTLEYDHERFDRFGRTLAYVYGDDGAMLNEELLLKGLAEPIWRFEYRLKQRFLSIDPAQPRRREKNN